MQIVYVDVVRMNDNVDDIVNSDADNDIIESHLTTEGTIRYTHAHKQTRSFFTLPNLFTLQYQI